MDLWIRTQDRMRLVIIKDFHLFENIRYKTIEQKNIVEIKPGDFREVKEKVKEIDEYINYEIWGDNHLLGTYKTKERALEVLDEIQKFLQPDFKCDGYETETGNGYYNMIKLHFSEPNIFHKRIYEMPKE